MVGWKWWKLYQSNCMKKAFRTACDFTRDFQQSVRWLRIEKDRPMQYTSNHSFYKHPLRVSGRENTVEICRCIFPLDSAEMGYPVAISTRWAIRTSILERRQKPRRHWSRAVFQAAFAKVQRSTSGLLSFQASVLRKRALSESHFPPLLKCDEPSSRAER